MRRISVRSSRGGLLLDAILGLAVILIGAYALDRLGITFGDLLNGVRQFFGI
jgi:hypothetical protein